MRRIALTLSSAALVLSLQAQARASGDGDGDTIDDDMLVRVFDALDDDGDGKVSTEAAEGLMPALPALRSRFAALDSDGDGVVTRADLVRWRQ